MPKTIPPLTAMAIRNARPHPTKTSYYRDGASPGLQYVLMPTGRSKWVLVIRDPVSGKRRRIAVECEGSLADARAKAAALRAQVKAGQDPTRGLREARQRAMDAKAGVGSLSAIVKAYGEQKGSTLRSWAEADRQIRRVFSKLLDTPALTLRLSDFVNEGDAYPSRTSADAAIRAIRPVLKWAAMRGTAPKDLHREIRPERATGKRTRTLSREELHAVLNSLGDSAQDRCVSLLLLTGVRREEAAGATWGEFDLDRADPIWTIPPARRKHTRPEKGEIAPLVVPLPRQAVALLRSMNATKPDDLVFQGEHGGSMQNWSRWQAKFNERSSTSGWHRHDLRRTVATLCGELGTPPHVVEIVLGHTDPHSQLASIYNRSRYSKEHFVALQNFADELDRIKKNAKPVETNVVPFHSAV